MKVPQLYNSNKDKIFKELLELAEQYVPEWNTDSEDDLGVVLAKIYAGMFEGTLNRFNKILYKNYIYFLNILGADTLPAYSARGYVHVKLNNGAYEGTFVKKGTRLYAQKENNNRVIYETKDDFLAVDNSIEAVYCVNSDESRISLPYEKSDYTQPFYLFNANDENNLQKFRIIISADEVFTLSKNSEIIITVFHNDKKFMEEKVVEFLAGDAVKWECSTADGLKEAKSVSFVANNIILKFDCDIAPVSEENNIEGCFIRCTVINKPKNMEISFTDLKISSKEEGLNPGYLYNNDIEIPKTEIMPFGEQFNVYDDFYINCDGAFNKRGSIINVMIDIGHKKVEIPSLPLNEKKIKWKFVMKDSVAKEPEKVPINVERVVWEYWNGKGWIRLFDDGRYQDIFMSDDDKSVQLVFECPNDIQSLIVGAYEGMWIRARIISVNNLFETNKYYNAPIIKDIKINFSYRDNLQNAKKVLIEKNLETLEVNVKNQTEINLFQSVGANMPVAYFALKNQLIGGPIKIFFQNISPILKEVPAVKWEYYGIKNGKKRWLEMKLMDETNFFSKSGLVTFIMNDPMEKLNLFSKNGFWLRAVNTDMMYDEPKQKKPYLKGIYFNTVKIVQQETMESEYFYINPQEEDKLIQVTGRNVFNCSVWVNEIETLLADERNRTHAYNKNVQAIRDENGMVYEYWVKWKRVESFTEYGEEDKVYRLDEKNGKILFGNGRHGKLPYSLDEPSIRVDYCITVGYQGNCNSYGIEDFVDSVSFVNRVFNVEPVSGGYDIESIEDAISRCSKKVRFFDRAVSEDDFEQIAKHADRNIARVKIIQGKKIENSINYYYTKVVILPKNIEGGEIHFLEIRNNVLSELMKKMPVTMSAENKITINEVVYAEISVRLNLIVESYNDYQEVYMAIENSLEKFLHPIDGGFDGKGFKIGEMPSRTKVFNLIKKIDKIKSIESLHLNCFEIVNGERKEISYSQAERSNICVPINGKHDIYINVI